MLKAMRDSLSGAAKTPARGRLTLQALGALVLLEGSQLLAARGLEPFASWFYVLAWWPYIFLIDTMLFVLKGESLLRSRPRELAAMLPWSVFIWLVFELYNLRLANWHYVNVTGLLWARWLGYLLSFATVLPAVLLTADLLAALGLFRGARLRPIASGRGWYPCFVALGVLCAVLPLLWPAYFFPLVWGAFVLLLEPVNHRAGAPSLMADLERGEAGRICGLLAAGAVCGLLWEFWNFWARTKWVYTVPFVGGLKLFEMPVAGFLGFPPFALECFVMYNFIRLCLGAAGEGAPRPARALAAVAVLALMCVSAFSAIDRATVLSFLR
jgi:hypothetical protein